MFWLASKKKPSDAVTQAMRKTMEPSVIASNMNVLGNIVSDGILDIDGQVDGNVRAHLVTVRPSGRITGDLIADEVLVHGRVDGLIKAQTVTLFDTARVHGTVMHESLTIEDGAVCDGKLKRMERLRLDEAREEPLRRSVPPISVETGGDSRIESLFVNDNDEPQSEAEMKILENLRLIS
jgi:cytoskeletal protein CcmA (bactofilin family)